MTVTPHMVTKVADSLGLQPEEVTDDMLKPFLLEALRNAVVADDPGPNPLQQSNT